MMRISNDPSDPDFVGDRTFIVVLDRLFFTRGPILEADEATGRITFCPVDERGHHIYDTKNGCWLVERVAGDVRIFEEANRC